MKKRILNKEKDAKNKIKIEEWEKKKEKGRREGGE